MNVLHAFGIGCAAAIGFASLTVLLLRGPLATLLAELCGSAGRARFWLVFTSVAIVLTAFLGMLVSFSLHEGRTWADYPQVPTVLGAFRTSLAYLLVSLAGLAFVLLLGISAFERDRRFAQRTGIERGWGSRPGAPTPGS